MVDVADPSAMTGLVPEIFELAATGLPAMKMTVPSAFTTGVAMERVLVSAFREDSVQVETPEASVTEHDPYELVVPVSVAPNVGVSPGTGLLLASRKVIVMVEVAEPSAITGPVPLMEELAATAPAEVKTTFEPALMTGVVIERVLVSATVDASVHVETPDAFEAEQLPYEFVVPVSVALNVGVIPDTGLLLTSARLIVTVEVDEPSAITGVVPVMLEFATTGAPAVKMTDPSAFTTGVAMERIFVSALRDVIVQVETPDALVTEQLP